MKKIINVAEKQKKKLLPIAVVLICGIAAVTLLWKTMSNEEMDVLLNDAEQIEALGLSEKETKYNEALTLAEEGQYGKAAIAFAKLNEYKDARKKSFEMWANVPNRQTITVIPMWETNKGMLLLALREDGKIAVDAFYSDKLTEDEMAEYEAVKYADIVSIHGAVGIKYDETLAFPEDNIQYTELGKWTDMIALSERDGTYVGLKSDGTLIFASGNPLKFERARNWTDIQTTQLPIIAYRKNKIDISGSLGYILSVFYCFGRCYHGWFGNHY